MATTVFTKTSILTFGKHKGKTIQAVIAIAPDYLIWALSNIAWFELDDEAMEDIDILTDGKIKRAPSEEDTPLFDRSKAESKTSSKAQLAIFDTFSDDDVPF